MVSRLSGPSSAPDLGSGAHLRRPAAAPSTMGEGSTGHAASMTGTGGAAHHPRSARAHHSSRTPPEPPRRALSAVLSSRAGHKRHARTTRRSKAPRAQPSASTRLTVAAHAVRRARTGVLARRGQGTRIAQAVAAVASSRAGRHGLSRTRHGLSRTGHALGTDWAKPKLILLDSKRLKHASQKSKDDVVLAPRCLDTVNALPLERRRQIHVPRFNQVPANW